MRFADSEPTVHPLAQVSLAQGVIGVVGGLFCLIGIVVGPIAIGCAITALVAINRDPQRWGGLGRAITGLVTGLLATGFALAAILLSVIG